MTNLEDVVDEKPTVAQKAWEELKAKGQLKNAEAFSFGGLFPQLYFCYDQDGSILMFSDRKEQWMFFKDAVSFDWAKKTANC